jgi:hypothetical protein
MIPFLYLFFFRRENHEIQTNPVIDRFARRFIIGLRQGRAGSACPVGR